MPKFGDCEASVAILRQEENLIEDPCSHWLEFSWRLEEELETKRQRTNALESQRNAARLEAKRVQLQLAGSRSNTSEALDALGIANRANATAHASWALEKEARRVLENTLNQTKLDWARHNQTQTKQMKQMEAECQLWNASVHRLEGQLAQARINLSFAETTQQLLREANATAHRQLMQLQRKLNRRERRKGSMNSQRKPDEEDRLAQESNATGAEEIHCEDRMSALRVKEEKLCALNVTRNFTSTQSQCQAEMSVIVKGLESECWANMTTVRRPPCTCTEQTKKWRLRFERCVASHGENEAQENETQSAHRLTPSYGLILFCLNVVWWLV